MSLFQTPTGRGTGGSVASAAPKPKRFEIKCGKMEMEGTTVTALPEKGKLYVKKDPMGLNCLCWQNRTTLTEDEPIFVFPGEQKLQMCKSAPASSRVMYLKLQAERRFFWLQEPDNAKDAEIIVKFNKLMNGEEVVEEDVATGLAQAGLGDVSEAEQMQMMRLMGLMPSTAEQGAEDAQETQDTSEVSQPAQEEAQAGQGQAFTAEMMQGLLQGLSAEVNAGSAVSLTDILEPAVVEALLTDDDTVERLLQFLPDGSNLSREDLLANVRSPQYAQALASFSAALQSGELSPAMLQLNAASDATSTDGPVAALCNAVQAEQDAETGDADGDDMDAAED
eukprot:m.46464 g.46464  ORF g.46464 m.46464 type:complete len:337 (-) comp10927_c0_seq2:1329-2339(-)